MPYIGGNASSTEKPTGPVIEKFFAVDRHQVIKDVNEKHNLGLDEKDVKGIMGVLPEQGEVDLNKIVVELNDKIREANYNKNFTEEGKHRDSLAVIKKLMGSK